MKPMVKRVFALVLCLIVLFVPVVCNACWSYVSVDELVQKSDMILIGKIKGHSGTVHGEPFYYDKWTVEVQYLLKGSIEKSEVEVLTPGGVTSVSYSLNQWGNEILLFLYKTNGYYAPFSPQAVVPVNIDKISPKRSNLKGISIVDPKLQSEEKDQIYDFIKACKIEKVNSITDADRNMETKDASNVLKFALPGILVLLAIGALSLHLIRRKRQKNIE